jgi:hypothetical protein
MLASVPTVRAVCRDAKGQLGDGHDLEGRIDDVLGLLRGANHICRPALF